MKKNSNIELHRISSRDTALRQAPWWLPSTPSISGKPLENPPENDVCDASSLVDFGVTQAFDETRDTCLLAAESPEMCDRCGSTRFFDVLIHDGRSTRRDCQCCRRTLGFPKWHP